MNWQALVDVVYDYWKENDFLTYGAILKYANAKFGVVGELAILVKNYNYQVENGGHLQYFENGYCQEEGGLFSNKDESIPLHRRMVEFFVLFELDKQFPEVYEIMQSFNVEIEPAYEDVYDTDCYECDGTGYVLDADGFETGTECPHCDGSGIVEESEYYEEEIIIDDNLDGRYYEVNDNFLKGFSEFIKNHPGLQKL